MYLFFIFCGIICILLKGVKKMEDSKNILDFYIQNNKNKYKIKKENEERNISIAEHTILSCINALGMYSEMYVSLIYNNLKVKEDLENLKQTIKEYDTWLDNIDAVLNFLYSNNDKWNIKDNNILFKSNELVAEYNELVNKVNSNKDILKEKLESIH